MKLGELLAITSEDVDVSVVDCATGEVIAYHDGENSIEKELTDKTVVKQHIQLVHLSQNIWVDQLCIEIVN